MLASSSMSGDFPSSASFNLKAGYQQMTTRFISMTAPDDVVMTPSIPGITGGTSNGSTTVTVTTDSSAGYSLSINAGESPAMVKGSDSIADYVPGGADPDYDFTIATDEAQFGYSPSGFDFVQRFINDSSPTPSCNAGATEDVLKCWDGLDTVGEAIAQSTSANNPNGATTTVYFRVGVGSAVNQTAGTYTATTTLTALAL